MNNYFETEEFKELLTSYEEQLERGESTYLDGDDYADLADYYLMQDRPEDARVVLSRGLELYEDNKVLLSTLCGLHIFMHDFGKARETIEENQLDGDEILYMKAQLAYAIDNDHPASEKLFRKWLRKLMSDTPEEEQDEVERDSYLHIISSFVDLHDDSLENDHDLEVIRRWIGDYAERFQSLGKYETDVQVADICRHNNLADLLVKLLVPILDERPYMKHGWSTLALAYLAVENYALAIESADFALAVDAHDKEAILTQAYSHNCLEHYDDACRYFEMYWQEDNIELAQGVPYASCLFSAGNPEKAYEMALIGENGLEADRIKKGLDTFENRRRYFMGMNDAINVFQDLGKNEDCERCVRRLLELEPNSHEYHFMLGTYLLPQGRADEAVESFGQAMMKADDKIMVMVDAAMVMLMNSYDGEALELVNMAEDFINRFDLNIDDYKNIYVIKSLGNMRCGDSDVFLDNLKIAAEKTPDLVKILFVSYFPEDMLVEEYYDYAIQMVRKLYDEQECG